MPEVAEIVDCHSTNIHAHLSRANRLKESLSSGERVVDVKHGWVALTGEQFVKLGIHVWLVFMESVATMYVISITTQSKQD
jgi:hypothetical protein